ncbi:MAG: glycosyltransferase family 39 protein [Nanoarchaeota archaeon]
MQSEGDTLKKRIPAVQEWLKDKNNLMLLAILFLAFIVRLYYFFVTKDQTVWWDEAEYMSTAKHWAFGVPFELNPQRPPLFQFLAALVFKLGLGEQFIKFFLVLLPSLIFVLAVYLLGKEMFDKKVGLIAAFLTSLSWTLLFWGSRVQPDFISMTFQTFSIFFMWRYWKNNNHLLVILSALFAGLGFYFKVSGLLVPISFAVFILIKDRLSAFKNKHNYYFAISFLLSLAPYFIWSKVTFNTSTAFSTGYSAGVQEKIPFAWYNLNLFYDLTGVLLFIIFISGVLISLKFLLFFDIIIKEKKKILEHPEVFSILVLLIVSSFYIFYIRAAQDRWVFLWLPFIFFVSAKSLIYAYSLIKKIDKNIAIFLLIGLVLIVGYLQLSQANTLIKEKKDSYLPVKLAALWMKDNSNPSDIILSMSRTQNTYYSERETYKKFEDESEKELEEYIKEKKPKFITYSLFEQHPAWLQPWIEKNQDKLIPVKAYFADEEQKNAVLVVYEINYN